MKLKLSVVLSAALVLGVGFPAWGAAVSSDDGAVSPRMVDDVARLADPVAGKRAPKRRAAGGSGRFADRSAQQALQVATEENPLLFASQPTLALDPPAGATVRDYLDDFSARIDIPGQKADAIAYSATPVQVERDGVKRPVDLKLTETGDAIEPKTPVVALSFAKTLGGGITIAKNIRMRVVGGDPDASAQVAGQQVFYANALRDADVFATPLPAGFETFVQLRSADSPTTIVYEFDLPAGARLVAQPGERGGVAILRANKVLATVSAPVSTDANDELVPTTMRVDGTRLVLNVAVSESTVLPVLVDPVVTDNQFYNGDAASTYGFFQNTLGWRRETSGPAANFTFSPNEDNPSGGGSCTRYVGSTPQTLTRQLCVLTQSSRTYSSEVGLWAWRPPGGSRSYLNDGVNVDTDAYVYRAQVRHSYTRLSSSGGAYMFAGIRSGRTGGWIGRSNNVDQYGTPSDYRDGAWSFGGGVPGVISNASFFRQYCAASDCSVEHPNEPNYDGASFAFGAYAIGSGHALSANAQGAVFYQYDRSAPTVTVQGDGSGWKRDGTVATLVSGTDKGMGMKTVATYYTNKNNQLDGASTSDGCTGGILQNCPRSLAQTFYTSVANLPEGIQQINGLADDVLGKRTAGPTASIPSHTVKVDRSEPTLTVTGALRDAAGASVGQSSEMGIVARDALSGVRSVDVSVDGAAQAPASTCLTDGCAVERTFTLDGGALEEGEHEIKVVATDGVGLTATQTWTVDVDLSPPLVGLEGISDGGVLTKAAYDVQLKAWDGDEGTPGGGVASLQLLLDDVEQGSSPPRPAPGAGLTREDTIATASLTAGAHTLEVRSTDRFGSIGTERYEFTVVHIPSLGIEARAATDAGTIISGPSSGARAGAAVSSVGDVNADGVDDIAIGAPAQAPSGRLGAGTVYIVSGDRTNGVYLNEANSYLYRIDGSATLEACGTSVSSAGDVNGDDIDDVLVGCPATAGLPLAVAIQPHAYVVFGVSGTQSNIDLASLGSRGFVINGPSLSPLLDPLGGLLTGAQPRVFGASVAGATSAVNGDVNGDELADLVIGSSSQSPSNILNAGITYVVFGKPGSSPVDATMLGSGGFKINGSATGEFSGYDVAVAGDLNEDGLADILVGAPRRTVDVKANAGSAYVVFGRTAGDIDLGALGDGGQRIDAAAAGDYLGGSVTGLGDVNRDGIDDIALGRLSGATIVRGQTTPGVINLAVSSAATSLNGPVQQSGLLPLLGGIPGATVEHADDLDEDSIADLLVGFPSPLAPSAPSAYAVYSDERTGDLNLPFAGADRATRINGPANSMAGASMATADDTQPDDADAPGASVITGAPASGNGTTYASRSTTFDGASTRATAQAAASRSYYNLALTPYPVRFLDPPPGKQRGTNSMPDSRKTVNGNRETVFPRRPDRGAFQILKANPAEGGARKWTFVDSFGNRIGTVVQDPKTKRVRAYDVNGDLMGITQKPTGPRDVESTLINPAVFKVQGKGCMASQQLTSSHRIVGFSSGLNSDFNESRTSDGKYIGLRAFLPVAAIPSSQVKDFQLPCYRPPAKVRRGVSSDLLAPGFPRNGPPRYQGRTSALRCPGDNAPRPITAENCGTPYANYTNFEWASDLLYVVQDTTGVAGGGVVKAIVRTGESAGRKYRPVDSIGYRDPNVPCNTFPGVRWLNARVTLGANKMYGWIPTRMSPVRPQPEPAPLGNKREC